MTFLLILCLAISWVSTSRAECQHSVVSPKGFRLDTTEKIYLDFHDCPDRVNITVRLWSLPHRRNLVYEAQKQNITHNNEPVGFEIKATSENLETRNGHTVYRAKLMITYSFPPAAQAIRVTPMNIVLNKTHGYVFMTTNRPAYRPKEKVNIKVAVTNQDLKSGERRLASVLIKTPEERITVDAMRPQWIGEDGFADFTYVVPDNPLKGVWWAEAYVDGVKMAEKSFLIDKYVLPTFDVKILPDYHFYIPGNSITGRITAEYSYGKKVSGLCYLSLKLIRGNGDEVEFYKRPATFDSLNEITRGKTSYNVRGSEIENILEEGETLQNLIDENARISITASVTGAVESVFESDYIDDILITNKPYFIDHSQSARFFLPHVVYVVKIIVRDIVSKEPLPNVPVTINWGWNGQKGNRSRNTDGNGEFYHEINGLTNRVERVTISAHNEDFDITVTDEMEVRKYDEDRAMDISLQRQTYAVGEELYVRFAIGNYGVSDIRYFVIARGKFILAEGERLDNQREVSVNFEVTADMVPNARIVAYYVLNDEMTSNSVWFDVVDMCKDELSITTNRDEVKPGDAVDVTVNGSPDTFFHLYGVDRASYFLHNETRVNRNQLWSKMEEYDTGCSRKGGLDAIHVFEEAGLAISSGLTGAVRSYRQMYCDNARQKRSPLTQPQRDDEMTVMKQRCYSGGIKKNLFGSTCEERERKIRENFNEMGRSDEETVSCIAEFHRACQEVLESWEPELMRSADNARGSGLGARTSPRKVFAEEWTFIPGSIPDSGQHTYSKRITRHSITTFELDAFGMSKNSPMCVAKTKYVKLFKNVFIQLYLPYSVRLREQTTIRVSVFNYGKENKQVEVLLKHSDHLCSRFQGADFLTLDDFVVPHENARSTEFTVLPVKLGKAAITVAAVRIQGLEEVDEDAVMKDLLVEEQGVHNESSKTIVIKAQENGRAKVQRLSFDFPNASVMMLQTRKCEIYAYAHPMGPNIEIDPFDNKIKNFGNYITTPRGCGEQNMMLVAPVIYIHSYRKSAMENLVTQQQEDQARKSITTGYANELTHRASSSNNKAFAVYSNYQPCTWLNAFVVKVFIEAKEYLQDMDPICNALEWLLLMQADDGHFIENFKIFHRFELRNLDTNDVILTAYITISLAEAKSACPQHAQRIETALSNGLRYVKQHFNDAIAGSYSLALGAYALAVSENKNRRKSEDARRWNRMLRNHAENDGEYIFWRGTRRDAANIETTAYALLAELTLNGITQENEDLTRNTAHWLVSRRNAYGGHKSTQDTVVAMQALSMYMTILETTNSLGPPPTNLFVNISPLDEDGDWTTPEVHLSSTQLAERQTIAVESTVMKGVSVSTTGAGVGSLTYRCTWRQHNNDENCHFILEVNVTDEQRKGKMKKVTVEVKTRPGDPPAGMSIIDFGVPSGWEPDEDSIKNICPEDAVDYQVDWYEIVQNTVKFYINKIDGIGKQLGFKIKKVVADIRNSQPVAVSAYDYYEPDIKCTKFYNLEGRKQIRAVQCDDRLCKCAEGDCPVCRTRDQQLNGTNITIHDPVRSYVDDRWCNNTDACHNMHTEICKREYAYIVVVVKVGNDTTPGFKYFVGTIREIFKTTARHTRATNSAAKFIIRQDCYESCKDERLEQVAKKKGEDIIPKFIKVARELLVSGFRQPVKDEEGRYQYDLTGGIIERMVPAKTCGKIEEKKKVGKEPSLKAGLKLKICEMKSTLRDAILRGCDY